MPELPEIVVISRQMNETVRGKIIEKVEIFQPKCLNCDERDYLKYLPGRKVEQVSPFGKWIKIRFDNQDHLFISLGMGGEIIYFTDSAVIPEKSKLIVFFEDGSGFYITLWWFGYFHLVRQGEKNQMTDQLGEDVLEISADEFATLLKKRKRARIKSFLLNQKNLRGIGNFYIQEILFLAKLHPMRQIVSLSDDEIEHLYQSIHQVMERSIALGSSSYELDFFGKKGKYSLKELSFAYDEDGCCPECGTKTQKIKTGSTIQYICPSCQVLNISDG